VKIGIVTANYNRIKVFRLWCASIQRLRDNFGDIPTIVTSEKDDEGTCVDYNIIHHIKNNNYFSRKFNKSMLEMRKQDVDYVMVLGSDDIVSNDLFAKILNAAESNPDLIYISNIYFYSPYLEKGLIKFVSERNLGVCRTVSRRVLDKVDWMPWHGDRRKGLDADMMNNIRTYVKTMKRVDGMVVDVKGRFSMNKFSTWLNKVNKFEDEQEFLSILSEKELMLLDKIRRV